MTDAVVGTEVDGYRIQSVLGRGGMGTVYRAEDVNLSRTVAIKRINPSQSDRESFIHRFRSEAQALARIDSPHIVGVYALRETDIGLLIVMEFVEGGTLKDPLDEQGALAPAQAIPILEQIMQAFHDAHSAGVIHRDIKPQNIMLTGEGMVKVTDFGIAKLRRPDSGETVTQGGQGGTLKYMSPEQISNISAVDARSDLYSIGMTAYEMMAGTLPFKESDTDFDIMRKVVEGEIPPPDEYNPDLPSGLAQWVVGAIRKQQDERYQSAEEMLDALREADRQVDATMTQPEWEVDDGSADVDETQTVVPGKEDRTQTVVPGGDEEDAGPVDPVEETVVGDPASVDEAGATQPAVPEASAEAVSDDVGEADAGVEDEASQDGQSSWMFVGGGLVVLLLLAIGGYVAFGPSGSGAGASATLSLTTTPAGATVLVNGDTAGSTPLNGYALEAGAVQLQVREDGYESLDSTFEVEAGTSVALRDVQLARTGREESASPARDEGQPTADAQPEAEEQAAASAEESDAQSGPSVAPTDETEDTGSEPATGQMDVEVEPTGTVLVDGEQTAGTGPVEVTAGEHTVTCRHPEQGATQTTVAVAEGETERLTCYSEHTVNVTTTGAWGRIWLNGQNTEKNTNARLSLPPGTHQIEVRRNSISDYQVEGGQVKIERGGASDLEKFTGSSYQLQVEPSFERVEYAVVFDVSGGE